MNSRKNILVISGFVSAVSLIAAAIAAWLVSYHCSRLSFDLLNTFCCEVIGQEPETQKIISAALKDYTGGESDGLPEEDILSALGYRVSDFSDLQYRQTASFAAAGLLAGLSLFFFTFLYRNRTESRRIRNLAEYLEQANSGKALILSSCGEDDFSRLEDEIYKTVTFLYQTKEQAVQAKNDFAENLSNIAHQIKTPITAASLAFQRLKQGFDRNALEQVEKLLSRLTYLEESLLLLSRLDAGALFLKREETDVFTLLVLAADNLQELFAGSGASIEIPEQGEMPVSADMDWTMKGEPFTVPAPGIRCIRKS